MILAPASTLRMEYQPFPDVARRNFMQEGLEVPAMVQLLGLPTGGRVLEVGCGRGIALRPLAQALRPQLLVGVDIDDVLLTDAARRTTETGTSARICRTDVRDLPFPDDRSMSWSISEPAITSEVPRERCARSCPGL